MGSVSEKGGGGKRRRGHGEGTIYKHPKGYYVAELYLGMRADGKRNVWRSPYFKRRRDAADALARAIEDRRQGKPIVTSRVPLAEYLDYWLETIKPTVEIKTYVEYERYAKRVIGPALGAVQLGKLDRAAIQKFVADLQAAGRSARYCQACFAVLRAALNDAAEWDLVAQSPAQYVKLPRPRVEEPPVWTDEHMRTFLAAIAPDPDAPVYVLAILTGARIGELHGLKWDDVDLARGTITIRRGVTRVKGHGLVVNDGKTESAGRTIALDPLGVEVLLVQRERVRELAHRPGWQENNLVFPKRNGGYRGTEGVRVKLQRICGRHGLPVITFHDLRHQHASLLLALGVHPKVVQQRLGHSSFDVTMDTYSQLLPGVDREAATLVGARLRELMAFSRTFPVQGPDPKGSLNGKTRQ